MTSSKRTMAARARAEGLVEPAWFSPVEAAIYLGVSLSHFYDRVIDHVEVRKIGKRSSVKRASLDAFMSKQELQQKIGTPGAPAPIEVELPTKKGAANTAARGGRRGH